MTSARRRAASASEALAQTSKAWSLLHESEYSVIGAPPRLSRTNSPQVRTSVDSAIGKREGSLLQVDNANSSTPSSSSPRVRASLDSAVGKREGSLLQVDNAKSSTPSSSSPRVRASLDSASGRREGSLLQVDKAKPSTTSSNSTGVRASGDNASGRREGSLLQVDKGKPSTPCSTPPRKAESAAPPLMEPTLPQPKAARATSTSGALGERSSLLEAPPKPRVTRSSSPSSQAPRENKIANERGSLLDCSDGRTSNQQVTPLYLLTPRRRVSAPPVTTQTNNHAGEKVAARPDRNSLGPDHNSKGPAIASPKICALSELRSVADVAVGPARDGLACEKIATRPGRGSTDSRRPSNSKGAADAVTGLAPIVPPKGGQRQSFQRPGSKQRDSRSRSTSVSEHPTVTKKLSESGEKIAACFKRFDTNNNGKISRDELAVVLRALDKHVKFNDEDVNLVLRALDTSGDGAIDYAEFAMWLTSDARPEEDFATSQFRTHSKDMLKLEQAQERCDRLQSH